MLEEGGGEEKRQKKSTEREREREREREMGEKKSGPSLLSLQPFVLEVYVSCQQLTYTLLFGLEAKVPSSLSVKTRSSEHSQVQSKQAQFEPGHLLFCLTKVTDENFDFCDN